MGCHIYWMSMEFESSQSHSWPAALSPTVLATPSDLGQSSLIELADLLSGKSLLPFRVRLSPSELWICKDATPKQKLGCNGVNESWPAMKIHPNLWTLTRFCGRRTLVWVKLLKFSNSCPWSQTITKDIMTYIYNYMHGKTGMAFDDPRRCLLLLTHKIPINL